MAWATDIGLEVHVQLKTRSKMFCSCSTAFGDPPNTNVCQVCLALPGALPVPNRAAVCLGVRTALALGCTVHNVSLFERKSYFYPDLPKGYQITQFQNPLATSGRLEIATELGRRFIGINRVHLEEDAGKSLHGLVPGKSAIDFNRSGVPLAEIVSEPDLRSPEESRTYLTMLKRLLQYLDVSDCSMEKGSLRIDANLSVRRPGERLGAKQELKNLNSFSAVVQGLTLLRDSQLDRLERGDAVEQQTFTIVGGELRAMRSKEDNPDYRYFPDPDLPPLRLDASHIDVGEEQASLPEAPWNRCARFQDQYDLTPYAADVVTSSAELADYFEAVVSARADPKEASNWVMDTVLADANKWSGGFRVAPERLAALVRLVVDAKISRRAGKEVFAKMVDDDRAPSTLAEQMGLLQVSEDTQLEKWVDAVLGAYPTQVERFGRGETKLLDFFIGRAMEESEGRANPRRLRTILTNRLSGS